MKNNHHTRMLRTKIDPNNSSKDKIVGIVIFVGDRTDVTIKNCLDISESTFLILKNLVCIYFKILCAFDVFWFIFQCCQIHLLNMF